jgi:hypothetical protein
MGTLMVAWEFREKIKSHKLFFDNGLDEYGQIALIRMFERLYESKEVDFFTGFKHTDDESVSELLKIENQIKDSLESGEEVYINITEALGTASAWLGERLLGQGVKFVSYNPSEHEITVLDKDSLITKEADRSMGIERLFWLRGFHIEVERDREYLKTHKQDLLKVLEKPNKYLAVAEELKSHKHLSLKNELFQPLEALSIIDENGGLIASKIKVEGGIFEEYVGALLSDMDFDDVVCGVKVFWGGDGINFSNEFDVLCLHKNTVFVVECKMRSNINEEELLYKYDALRRYAAPNSKAMVVHLATKKNMPQVSDGLYMRFRFAGIGLYSAKKISQERFSGFVNKLFFNPHPSHLLWIDSQAASSKVFIEISNEMYEEYGITAMPKSYKAPQARKALPAGLVYVADQKLPPILADIKENPLVYYYMAMTNLLKQLAGWSHKGLAYAKYKEYVWRAIVTDDYKGCGYELVEAVENLQYDNTFRQLREIARLYFEIPPTERHKTNESFVALVLSVKTIYEKMRAN